MRKLLATVLAAGLISTAARGVDNEAPVITHTPVTRAPPGGFVEVMAKITDASKFFPQVFYRYDSSGGWLKPLDMKPVKGQPNMFGANIPVRGETVEYYIEAYDELGNGPGRAGAPEAPLRVRVGEEPKASAAPPPAAAPAPSAAATPPPSASGWPAPAPAKPPARAPIGATSRAQPSAGPTRIWTWAVGGTGLGLLAGGLIAGTAAKSAGNAYNDRLKDPQNNPVTLQSQYDAAQAMGTKATILTISGLVLVAGGAALYFLEPGFSGSSGVLASEPPRAEPGISVAAAPVDGGGAVAVAGRF
jgi:hypothetical protein